jgi:hypothetical protein
MATRTKALVARPIIPGVGSRLRAWLYLIGLIVVSFYSAFGVGNGNQTQVQIGAMIGLVVVFIGAVNTPYELPNTASALVPWFTSQRCFWLYRGIVVLGPLMAGFGAGNDAQWATFTTALGTIFGLGVATLRTSLVKAVNAPEVV